MYKFLLWRWTVSAEFLQDRLVLTLPSVFATATSRAAIATCRTCPRRTRPTTPATDLLLLLKHERIGCRNINRRHVFLIHPKTLQFCMNLITSCISICESSVGRLASPPRLWRSKSNVDLSGRSSSKVMMFSVLYLGLRSPMA